MSLGALVSGSRSGSGSGRGGRGGGSTAQARRARGAGRGQQVPRTFLPESKLEHLDPAHQIRLGILHAGTLALQESDAGTHLGPLDVPLVALALVLPPLGLEVVQHAGKGVGRGRVLLGRRRPDAVAVAVAVVVAAGGDANATAAAAAAARVAVECALAGAGGVGDGHSAQRESKERRSLPRADREGDVGGPS